MGSNMAFNLMCTTCDGF